MLVLGRTCKNLAERLLSRNLHQECKVRVKDIDINITTSGSGEKSVLLMPGALGSAKTDFKPQIEELPCLLPNYTIIAWDPPGYGKSIPPERCFDLEFFHRDAQYALDLMKALKRESFSILGWSDGGITGLIMAGACARNNVNKLVIWGSNAYVNDNEVKVAEGLRDVSTWSAKMREPMEAIYGVENFPKLWSAWVDAYINFNKKRGGDICKTEVNQIEAPTLILHGKKDPVIDGEHIPYLRKHIANSL